MNDRTNGAPDGAAQTNGDPDQAAGKTAATAGKTATTAGKTATAGGTRAQERIAALDTSGAGSAAEIASLRDALEAATAAAETATTAAEEAQVGWQRSRADFANYKRRNEQERAERAGLADDSLLLRVVGLADDFDLAIEHVPAESLDSAWVEGIAAIDRKLRGLLDSAGVKPMDSEGQLFDPHEHQAISYEETTEAPDGTVLKELQRGYRIRDRVLRPALVAVARNDGDGGGPSDD